MSRQIIAETAGTGKTESGLDIGSEGAKLLALYVIDGQIENCPCLFGGSASAAEVEAALRKATDAGLGWQGLRLAVAVVSDPTTPPLTLVAREALTRTGEDLDLGEEFWQQGMRPGAVGEIIKATYRAALETVRADVDVLAVAGITEADAWPNLGTITETLALDAGVLMELARNAWPVFGADALAAVARDLTGQANTIDRLRASAPPYVRGLLAATVHRLQTQATALQQAADAEAEGRRLADLSPSELCAIGDKYLAAATEYTQSALQINELAHRKVAAEPSAALTAQADALQQAAGES